jgi:hypothetical protein
LQLAAGSSGPLKGASGSFFAPAAWGVAVYQRKDWVEGVVVE